MRGTWLVRVRVRLDEGDEDDDAGEKYPNESVGVSGNIEIEHGGYRPFTGLDGAVPAKV